MEMDSASSEAKIIKAEKPGKERFNIVNLLLRILCFIIPTILIITAFAMQIHSYSSNKEDFMGTFPKMTEEIYKEKTKLNIPLIALELLFGLVTPFFLPLGIECLVRGISRAFSLNRDSGTGVIRKTCVVFSLTAFVIVSCVLLVFMSPFYIGVIILMSYFVAIITMGFVLSKMFRVEESEILLAMFSIYIGIFTVVFSMHFIDPGMMANTDGSIELNTTKKELENDIFALEFPQEVKTGPVFSKTIPILSAENLLDKIKIHTFDDVDFEELSNFSAKNLKIIRFSPKYPPYTENPENFAMLFSREIFDATSNYALIKRSIMLASFFGMLMVVFGAVFLLRKKQNLLNNFLTAIYLMALLVLIFRCVYSFVEGVFVFKIDEHVVSQGSGDRLVEYLRNYRLSLGENENKIRNCHNFLFGTLFRLFYNGGMPSDYVRIKKLEDLLGKKQ